MKGDHARGSSSVMYKRDGKKRERKMGAHDSGDYRLSFRNFSAKWAVVRVRARASGMRVVRDRCLDPTGETGRRRIMTTRR